EQGICRFVGRSNFWASKVGQVYTRELTRNHPRSRSSRRNRSSRAFNLFMYSGSSKPRGSTSVVRSFGSYGRGFLFPLSSSPILSLASSYSSRVIEASDIVRPLSAVKQTFHHVRE